MFMQLKKMMANRGEEEAEDLDPDPIQLQNRFEQKPAEEQFSPKIEPTRLRLRTIEKEIYCVPEPLPSSTRSETLIAIRDSKSFVIAKSSAGLTLVENGTIVYSKYVKGIPGSKLQNIFKLYQSSKTNLFNSSKDHIFSLI